MWVIGKCESLSPIHPACCLTTQCKRFESEFTEVRWTVKQRREVETLRMFFLCFCCGFKLMETETNMALCKHLHFTCHRCHMITALSGWCVLIAEVYVEQCTMIWFKCYDWKERTKKKESSVIVPWNEIDSHPTEHEMTLADDTVVTVAETQHHSNGNNQHLLAEHRHTAILWSNSLKKYKKCS